MLTAMHEDQPRRQKPGQRRKPLPPDAPLTARKMVELLDYLDLSAKEFGRPIYTNEDCVRKWYIGSKVLSGKDLMVIAHYYDVPQTWWTAPGVPIRQVIGKGRGQDEKKITHGAASGETTHQEGKRDDPEQVTMKRTQVHRSVDSWARVLNKLEECLRLLPPEVQAAIDAARRDKE